MRDDRIMRDGLPLTFEGFVKHKDDCINEKLDRADEEADLYGRYRELTKKFEEFEEYLLIKQYLNIP